MNKITNKYLLIVLADYGGEGKDRSAVYLGPREKGLLWQPGAGQATTHSLGSLLLSINDVIDLSLIHI